MGKKMSRRKVLVTAGQVGAGIVVGTTACEEGATQPTLVVPSSKTVPYYGFHQPGITTPAQDHLHFAAFDLLTPAREQVRGLLQIWSSAIATMMQGHPIGEGTFPEQAPPPDTGEALNLNAANLTVTIGFGPTLFTRNGIDRYGLAAQRPAALIDLPPMPRDALNPDQCGGDLCVQACSDNPQVAFHAVRNLTRLGRGLAVMRWSQLGFNRTASTTHTQQTPRNLMGFKDGTNNLKAEDQALMEKHVWVGPNDTPAWMHGGSYLVARRIRMHLEAWDRDSLSNQEMVIGRHKVSGSPLGKQHEFDAVDLSALPGDAHVRLAIGDTSIKLLRRGYSFTDGMDLQRGELDAGLFFIAFQRDPRTQFVPLQMRLGRQDALNEYITHVGSALFACPPGTEQGGFVGETLFPSQ